MILTREMRNTYLLTTQLLCVLLYCLYIEFIIFCLDNLKMPIVKQVTQKIVIMEKFASLDSDNKFEELYSERSLLADLGFILIGDAQSHCPRNIGNSY